MDDREVRATALKIAAETSANWDDDRALIERADVLARYILTGDNVAEGEVDGEEAGLAVAAAA